MNIEQSMDKSDRLGIGDCCGPVLIVGNCIAGMVAALELGSAGVDVVLINPSSQWGGHFSSKRINGPLFDLGMVGFEFTGFHRHPSNDVRLYEARQRNNVARFCARSQEYVESLIKVHRARAPVMLWNDGIYPDVLMANDLAVLKKLAPGTATRIEREVNLILSLPDSGLHASKKVDNPGYLSSSFEQASLANHGRTFHELFIAPFANKLFPGGASRFAALYHRCLWMPLYYPETVLAAMGERPHDLTTLFHYPAAGYIGALADAILAKLQALRSVQVVRAGVKGICFGERVSLALTDGSAVEGQRLIWGLDLAGFLRLADVGELRQWDHQFAKTSADFGFFIVDRSHLKPEFSSLFVLDPSRLIYRITNLSDSGGTDEDRARLVLECNSHFLPPCGSDSARMIEQATLELLELGLVSDRAAILDRDYHHIEKIMPLPNKVDHELFWESHDIARAQMPGVSLIGPSSGYLITTLNDQVIQGLKVAAEIRS